MADLLCRLTVQLGDNDAARAVDLTLPTAICLGQVMPPLLALVAPEETTATHGRRWRLSHIGGPTLDESLTLMDNGVRDGDLLLLTTVETPAPQWSACDPSRALVRTDYSSGEPLTRALPAICCVLLGAVVAAALMWAQSRTAAPGILVAPAVLALSAGAAAVVTFRVGTDPLLCTALSLVAVTFAAATGFISVPAGPPPAHVLLSSAAALSAAIVMLRLTGCSTTCLTAVVTATGLMAAISAMCVVYPLSTSAMGAALAALSLAVVGVGPRLTVVLTGANAGSAHQVLTGVVTGSAMSSALGAATVVAGHFRDGGSALVVGVFLAVISTALALRARTHADPRRQFALVAGGLATAVAVFTLAVISAPQQAHWPSVAAAALSAAVLRARAGLTVGPAISRGVDIVEYLALAAVIPMACWVAGVYGVVRGMSLL